MPDTYLILSDRDTDTVGTRLSFNADMNKNNLIQLTIVLYLNSMCKTAGAFQPSRKSRLFKITNKQYLEVFKTRLKRNPLSWLQHQILCQYRVLLHMLDIWKDHVKNYMSYIPTRLKAWELSGFYQAKYMWRDRVHRFH